MNFRLTDGYFTREEALEFLTKIISLKIRYHEEKLVKAHKAEEIERRESHIKQLHKEFYEAKQLIMSKNKKVELHTLIEIK